MRRALIFVAACGTAAPAPHPIAPRTTPGASTAPPANAVVPPPDPTPPALRLPHDVVPTAYRVRWDVDADRTTFTGHVDIDVSITTATDHVWLDATGLALTAPSFTRDGHDAALTAIGTRTDDVVGFRFPSAQAPGAATLHLDFAGGLQNEFAGLFREQDLGRFYLYSQFESSFARRAVPCFDEPQWKVPWTVTIAAPIGQRAFSNTPIHATRPRADGVVETEFEPTPPLPSYLIAFAVGPFETVDAGTVGKAHVPARIVVPAGHAAEATFAASATGKVVDALEDYFDLPLPLAKLDEVAVPRFFGAMENPGLITYQASILLAPHGHDDDEFRHQFLWISGHELAHQWFGDLVTLDWWDDLWLNESFATWMSDKVGQRLDPHWDSALRNADETEKAMEADTDGAARALHHDVKALSDVEGTFDAIMYEKGGAVLSMFERWIGPDKFRAGVRAYVAAHARGTASTEDFLDAIAGAGVGPDVRDAIASFVDQPGVPLVRASLRCDAGKPPALALSQERLGAASSGTIWKLPVCVRWIKGAKSGEQCALVTAATATIALDAPGCPDVIDANAGAAGYYRVLYDDALSGRLLLHLDALRPIERLALAADTGAVVDSGDVELSRAVALAGELFTRKDAHAELAAIELIARTGELVGDDHRDAWRRWVQAELGPRARKLGLTATAGADEVTARARRRLLEVDGEDALDPALGKQARALADAWLSGKRTLEPDDLERVFSIAATGADAGFFDRVVDAAGRSKDVDEVGALAAALGDVRDPALIARDVDLFADGRLDPRVAGRVLGALFAHADTRARAWDALRARFDDVVARLPRSVAGYIALAAAGFCDDAHRREADDFLRPRVAKLAEGPQHLAEALAHVDRCIALRTRNADAVTRWLK